MTSANRFMNEMVEAIKTNKSFDFRRKYSQNTDVLIIDDIHELKNKNTTQEMFFHIFNELIEKGKQLIFTSDKIPKEIDGLEDRIRTRLSSALPVEIQQPDLETRIAILKKKAVEKDVYLSDDVVNLIAKCVKSNIRELEGCLVKLGAVTSILKVDIDLEVAKEHLKLNEELENQKNITIESLARQVAHYYKIPVGDLRGTTRTKEVVLARQVAMYLISKLLRPTLKENGHFFSGRDHSTVLHAIKIISDRIKFDSQLSQQLLDIEKQI
jgi:chromosomal replication initiator protein